MIQRTIETEQTACQMYVQLSQMFAHVPEVSDFWQDLAYGEAKHAYTLQKIQTSLSDEQLAAASDRPLMDSATSLTHLLNEVSIGAVETLGDAYEIAHELEYSEVNNLFKCLGARFITRKEAKQIVLREIVEHLQKLVDFTKNFGDRTSRRQIRVNSATGVPSD